MTSLSNNDFVDLHVHSSFSILDGAANPDLLIESAKRLGRTHLALTDHGNMDGAVRFARAAKKADIKPIFGIELFMAEDFARLDDSEDRIENLHLTALAKTPNGFRKLMKACGFAHNKGWSKVKRRPFLPIDYPLNNQWAGDIIILTGCASSPFWKAKDGLKWLPEYASGFKEDFYAEIMPNEDWARQNEINALALESAKIFGLKSVATTDIHYINREDSEYHEVLLGLSQRGMTWKNPKRWKFESHSNYVHKTEEILEALKGMGLDESDRLPAILNTREIAEKCFNKLEPVAVSLPEVVKLPPSLSEEEFFRKLSYDGLAGKGLADMPGYKERLARELEIIIRKNFTRYMLMVWDVVRWAKEQGILVGPSRGSVGGSLVAYALNITDIDPIQHRLWFERFIAEDRLDMPDIDLDYPDSQRHLIETYLKQKYGEHCVAHVSTFATMLGKSAIKDVGRLFEVPLDESERMSKCLIHRHDTDERAHHTIEDSVAKVEEAQKFAQKYPQVVRNAMKLEGKTKASGIHAAGYVVSPTDLRTADNAYLVTRKDMQAVNWDKDDLEHMGLVKLDILGLSTLSAVAEAVRLVKARHGIQLEMARLPIDDAKTYSMVSRGDTATVFQLGTPGTMKYCKGLKPDNFEHLAAIPALWKPGPIDTGAAEEYRRCKLGLSKPIYLNEAHRNITQITYGQLIYQEQIVSLLIEMAGFEPKTADKVRKVISKQQGAAAWGEYEEAFVQGCVNKKTLKEGDARELWRKLTLFSAYCLNRAHAVGYGMLAYWTAYLKANYPSEWLCAYLNYGNADKEDNTTGQINRDVALKEARKMGFEILKPDINKSDVYWSIDAESQRALRVGLKDIMTFGNAAIEHIGKIKSTIPVFHSFDHFLQSVERRIVNKRIVKALVAVGALDGLLPENEKERWYSQFDGMYETIEKPKKRLEVLAQTPEAQDKETLLQSYLRFDPWAVGDKKGTSLESRLGEGFEVYQGDDGDMILQRDDKSWSMSDVQSGNVSGLTGLVGPQDVPELSAITKKTKACESCDLRKGCRAPVPIEVGKLNLMIVAEAPGKNEDERGKPLVGESGQLLWQSLRERGLERADFFISNTVKCRPAANKKPTPEQINDCLWLPREIRLVKPIAVLALGNSALYAFTGREKGIMDMSGTTEWNHKYGCWVTFGMHPASVLYHPENESLFLRGIDEFVRIIKGIV